MFAEMKPACCRTAWVVASASRSISCCWLSGFTVNTLIKVAMSWLVLMTVVTDCSSLRCWSRRRATGVVVLRLRRASGVVLLVVVLGDLEVVDDAGQGAHELSDLAVAEVLGGGSVHLGRGVNEVAPQCPRVRGEQHRGTPPVTGVWFPPDQKITLHALEGLRHGRLLDPYKIAQLSLGQAVFFVKGENLGELSRHHAQGRDPLVQGGFEQPCEVIDLIAQGALSHESVGRIDVGA